MKISKLVLENIKSFKSRTEIDLSDDLNIFIGPNAGGKSNLLDIITIVIRHFFLHSFRIVENGSSGGVPFYSIEKLRAFSDISNHLSKYIGNENYDSRIEITFKISREDIANFSNLKSYKIHIEKYLQKFRGHPLSNMDFIDKLDAACFVPNSEFTFIIINNQIEHLDETTKDILHYFNFYELFILASNEIDNLYLNPLTLYFSPYRVATRNSLDTNLSSGNLNDLIYSYTDSTSKTTNTIFDIFTRYYAEKLRHYELTSGDTLEKFRMDSEVRTMNKYLQAMGYELDIRCINMNQNIYEFKLVKEGIQFSLNQASSGEKEILNFLFGIFTFNISNGLVIIDEPELHLHPKWQRILLNLLLDLSKDFHNQYIIVTHSPIFINEITIENVFRVFKQNAMSKVVTPDKDLLPDVKDLLHLVNTLNNEKIFFADKVVLVEGITDRLIFEKIYDKVKQNSDEITEFTEVHGKNNFAKYRNLLNCFKINNYLIADRDFVLSYTEASINSLFRVDESAITTLLKDKKSTDRKMLARILKEIIESLVVLRRCNPEIIGNLESVWSYIESRNQTLKPDITPEELQTLSNFIDSQFSQGIFILKEGEIEDYIPELSNNKKLENAIEFINSNKFDQWFSNPEESSKREELIQIMHCLAEDR